MATVSAVRREALEALRMILEESRPSHLVIREKLAENGAFDRRERAFFTRLCEGTVERKIQLDYVLEQCSSTPVARMKPLIRTLLRMSVYQLLFMDGVPAAAACSEAVGLAEKSGFRGLKGYVNGVLRGVCRLEEPRRLPDREADGRLWLSVAYSAPPWLVDRLCAQYGKERAEEVLRGYFAERPVTARINLTFASRETVFGLLREDGVEAEEIPGFPEAAALPRTGGPARLAAVRRGLIQIQDIASMLPVYAARLRPGETVVDVCAAPGGKSLHAADVMGDRGLVIARDLSENKVGLIRENLRREPFSCVRPERWDALDPDPELAGKADAVLADLPCSGLGIIGKKPDIKYRTDPEQIAALAALQRKMLAAAQSYVRPGGRLVFSTCTLTPEENGENRLWFLREFPQFLPLELSDPHFSRFGESTLREGYIQLLPGIHPCDGFYVAAFVRRPQGANIS